ncbi:hypothetical protein [Phaeobacter sp. 22II1-1F12B]|uniref:hypothetical protein n=1 Tax=Phaeobacter sp. 22II1-1F12B TaxID=1317111 RepID=UPI000B5281F4|nr:hypothetical protein [Phaeobacter sp. 22II1-1F12B]OWU79333.1 hypothetical protein ATO1_11525 [Phaeobacter sp. 22II1-1F12B]
MIETTSRQLCIQGESLAPSVRILPAQQVPVLAKTQTQYEHIRRDPPTPGSGRTYIFKGLQNIPQNLTTLSKAAQKTKIDAKLLPQSNDYTRFRPRDPGSAISPPTGKRGLYRQYMILWRDQV